MDRPSPKLKLLLLFNMNRIVLLTGSNIGDSLSNLTIAKKGIKKHIGEINAESSIYVTAAWGKTDQPDFLNQILIVDTSLSSTETLLKILAIEEAMGRIRTEKNAPRIIDIDILFYNNDKVQESNLEIPHPLIGSRRFVLEPLNEVLPDYVHPVSKKKINQMLLECTDDLIVRKM